MDIKELHRQGLSVRQIARQTGRSRHAVARVLKQGVPRSFARRVRKSHLDPYKPYLKKRYDQFKLSAVRLLEEIRAEGYAGSIDIVQRYLKTLKDEQTSAARATVRFETAPGQQAQADWAETGRDEIGKIYAFVMVLSFSRTLYLDFTRSMECSVLIACHQDAFGYFGGVPAAVLYDNMAQVRLPGGELNPLFLDFAGHYGFTPKTHRPYRPRTKGKVERMVDYIKDNFLNGRTFAGFDDLRAQGRLWQEKANARVHSTTGERPCDLLPREKLTPILGVAPYVLAQRRPRKVDAEGYVHFDRSRYSVPPALVGKRVVVIEREQRIQVRTGDMIVAEHNKAKPGSCVAAREHVEAMWQHTLANSSKRSSQPVPRAEFLSAEAISTPPLAHYEEVVQ